MPVTWRSLPAAPLLLASLLIVATFPSFAAPPQPHAFYGQAYDAANVTLPLGEKITAWVDGVDYSNATLVHDDLGSYELDVYGNWHVTNASQTPEILEGAEIGDDIMFVHGDLTASGAVFEESAQWYTGNYDLVDLHEAPVQPRLLKVSCITLRPVGTDQWVRIYNPGTTGVDLSNYYLKKDGVGLQAFRAWWQYPSGAVPANGFVTVALTGSPLNATGDDLELVYRNSNGTSFGGADVIVDRVEWNQTVGGTHYWESSNTIMSDARLNASAKAIYRGLGARGRPVDTNNNYDDFAFGPTCFPDPAPAAPILLSAVLSGGSLADVTLRWQLSGDDGAGEDDVTGYEIWRGTAYQSSAASYTLVATLAAGTDTYVDAGVGVGDTINHFYQVRALENGTGRWTAAGQQAGELSRSLTALRHLLSVPLEQSNWTITSVFQTVDYRWIRTYGQKSGHGHNWHNNHKGKPWNDIDTLDIWSAFWVDVATPGDWVIAGLVPTSTTITIDIGWNFVGYPSLLLRQVGTVLAGISYQKVEGYSTNPPFYLVSLSPTDLMAPTNGYWVHASAAGTYTFTN